ncbi:MAG TPA: M23 family metallopeptidase [Symbiobacteriaceae bacterium]|nr:M23 family metallopeptidase [Symbiobacteriaceae bacterium]
MASSTSWFCGAGRIAHKLARQWYGHFAGLTLLWTRLAAPWAILAAWLGGEGRLPSAGLSLAVAPLCAALYSLAYVVVRCWVRIPLTRLKAFDIALLVLAPGAACLVLSAPAPAELRLWLWLPALGLAGPAWYLNWCHQGSTASPGPGAVPVPPPFVIPVRGPITAGYRSYDVSHTGIDVGVPEGTPVVAPAPGVVLHAGPLEQWGYAVHLDHGEGWSTFLAHLERPAVRRGARVGAGDVVGWSGTSGISTGPHVHVELRFYGEVMNPGPLSARVQVRRNNRRK